MELCKQARCDAPIGIFDSGVGGISVLQEIRRQLPSENIIYYGDTAHAPYGTKPVNAVMACVRQVMDELLARGVKAVVIACNTATSVAASTLRAEMTLPIIGMEPALKPASEMRHGGTVLVMATPVTLRLPKFQALMDRYGEGAVPLPCPGLMDLVERGCLAGREVESYLRELLSPWQDAALDAVVLGCTHYVFLRPALRRLLPPETALLDGNEGTARQLRHVLASHDLLRPEGGNGQVTYLTSGEAAVVIPQMEQLATVSLSENPGTC